MEHTPIYMITTRAALLGAATFGLQSLSNLQSLEEAKTTLATAKFAGQDENAKGDQNGSDPANAGKETSEQAIRMEGPDHTL